MIFQFTYANPQNNLPHLKRERDSHFHLMVSHYLDKGYFFFQKSDFSHRDFDFGFNDYLDKVSIFHFSGHADTDKIILADGSAYTEGIALQLKSILNNNPLSRLKLIFLNGCSTGFMVDQLLDAGVPIVIGTSAPVEDGKAADFSINFYTHLINGNTIDQAFEYAQGKLKTTHNDIEFFRGIRPEGIASNQPLWGIFYQKKQESLLGTQFLKNKKNTLTNSNYKINAIIRGSLYRSLLMAKSKSFIELEKRRIAGEFIDEKIIGNILSEFPGPIFYHLRTLLMIESDHEEKEKEELLQIHLFNIFKLYQALLELLFFIMLSQLWDICLKAKKDKGNGVTDSPFIDLINPSVEIKLQLNELKDFFSTTRKERQHYDFIIKIRAIRKIFDLIGQDYFIEELKQLKIDIEEEKEFTACNIFFNQLNNDLKQKQHLAFDNQTWETKCEEAELHLAFFLDKISFCSRYDFAILKNIELFLPRHLALPSYTYNLKKIPKGHNTTYELFQPVMKDFTSVKSIIMLKTIVVDRAMQQQGGTQQMNATQEVNGQINLSPFMLDYNVNDPAADKGDLIIFSHYNEKDENYVFERALSKKNIERIITKENPNYQEIKDTINEVTGFFFDDDINGL